MGKRLLNLTITILGILSVNSVVYDSSDYELINYNELNTLMEELKLSKHHNNLFKIRDAFEEYPAIPKIQCPSERSAGNNCKSYIIEIANFEKGKAYVNRLPTVFIIAGFHGNEVTGTNAIYQFMKILDNYYDKNSDLSALLQNVRLLMLPTANVNGFDRMQREELINGVSHDPNRDFPYDIERHEHCFQTTTAMVIDSIFRDNIIIGSITFHGGANSITYPWGNFAHELQPKTGDNEAFAQVAQILKNVSGENIALDIQKYKVGLLQDIVYDVHGGFEDWAYGASWDKKNINQTCASNTSFSSSVSANEIRYKDHSNRAFIFLVEAGDSKVPSPGTLGNELALFYRNSVDAKWGNVTRNIALLMKFTEVVQPYMVVNQVTYGNTLVLDLAVRGCGKINSVTVPDFDADVGTLQYDIDTNEHTVMVSVKNVKGNIPEVAVEYKCDEGWKKETVSEHPESHLVKLRTDPFYRVHYNNYTVTSQTKFKTRIFNIKTDQLVNTLVHSESRGIFTLAYHKSYKAKIGDIYMLFNYSDDYLTVKPGGGDITKYEIIVHQFGTIACCQNVNKFGSTYLIIKSADKIEISSQKFLELLGRSVSFRDFGTKEIVGTSFIELIDNTKHPYLFIPHNGLTAATGDINNYYYVTVKEHEKKQLRIEVYTAYQGALRFQIGKIRDALFKDPSFKCKQESVTNHYAIIDVTEINDLRMRGAEIKLLDLNGKVVFEGVLNILDPYHSEVESLNYEAIKHAANVRPLKPAFVISGEFITLVVAIILATMGLIYYYKKKSTLEPLKDHRSHDFDLQNAKNGGAVII